ncbi:cytochrome c oxidase assembly protein [Bradyrhizobium sp. LB11.1]|uniref:cytochrome c oxidase assembly protein n=1 Tax=Bradyrhizobium sp. LB11.1 TaxID=3156326 RepID=UPI0033951ECE
MKLQTRKNLRVVVPCLLTIGIMIGLVAYSPTLYRLFCGATGYGGTTQRAAAGLETLSDRTVTVLFDTNVAPDLQWRFEPEQREVNVRLGEQKLVFFSAENLSDQSIVGHAAFNVSPGTTGIYFNKIQCFCFDDERLEPHEKVDMPVVFFVDPAMANDPETASVDAITLSYTFYRSATSENAKDLSRFLATSAPDAGRGRQLFVERCAACHSLEANKAGPMLGNVVGRRAGSEAGYSYSAVLRSSALTWSAITLDNWLSDPRKFIAGTKMPIRVLDASARRDIIAYLEAASGKSSGSSERKTVAQGPSGQQRKE